MLDRIKSRTSRVLVVALAAFAMVAMQAVAAFAEPPAPVQVILDEAELVASTNVPLILAALAVIFGLGLGVTIAWTAYRNAKKGIRSVS